MNPNPNAKRLRGILLVFAGAGLWGFSANCVSWLTTYGIDVLWLGNMRLLCAGLCFLALALIFERSTLGVLFRKPRLMGRMVAYTLFGVILMQVSYMLAIKYTNPGTALLLQECGVPMVMLYTCLRKRTRPTGPETIALILAVLGILLISTQGDIRTLDISPQGLFWGICAGVALAAYNIIPPKLISECGLFSTNAISMLLGAVMLTPFVRPWESAVAITSEALLVLAGVIVLGTLLAYMLYLKGLMDAGPVDASLIGVFEPVSGAVIAAIWLGTVFSGWDILGGIAIIAMMIIVAKSSPA